jgi:hypothetical protein
MLSAIPVTQALGGQGPHQLPSVPQCTEASRPRPAHRKHIIPTE